MSKTVHRIIKVIEYLNLSARQFDISIGTGNGYILRMKKNNASVGSDVIERIIEVYPQINLVWLITGKGSMLIQNNHTEIKKSVEIEDYIDKKINQTWHDKKNELVNDILKRIDFMLLQNK